MFQLLQINRECLFSFSPEVGAGTEDSPRGKGISKRIPSADSPSPLSLPLPYHLPLLLIHFRNRVLIEHYFLVLIQHEGFVSSIPEVIWTLVSVCKIDGKTNSQ
jgi:hypothetical protein